ncbi:MAG: hypothetical protein GEU73_02730 [Chloroflexi bacterium]|nr:hypothetical protein [Chloroflexota bacterium]
MLLAPALPPFICPFDDIRECRPPDLPDVPGWDGLNPMLIVPVLVVGIGMPLMDVNVVVADKVHRARALAPKHVVAVLHRPHLGPAAPSADLLPLRDVNLYSALAVQGSMPADSSAREVMAQLIIEDEVLEVVNTTGVDS